ncbi:MAG: type II toxin-antitoxin system VapB family antitoxin [Cytophagaceae bacterium]|nr:type II toxin-antitoxin system VapB family antitoxin [Cytophagaceae bacterium]
MKTSIEIDEQLLTQAQALTQAKSKDEVVNLALQTLIQALHRQQMLNLRGNVQWEGNLDEMRAA